MTAGTAEIADLLVRVRILDTGYPFQSNEQPVRVERSDLAGRQGLHRQSSLDTHPGMLGSH